MRSNIFYLCALLIVLLVPGTHAFAQGQAPFQVNYKCSVGHLGPTLVGTLDFGTCLQTGPLFQAHQCWFSASFPTVTHPSGTGEAGVSATFLVESPSPIARREVCLSSSAGAYGGAIDGPLPFAFISSTSGFANGSAPKSLKDCAVWVRVGKSFNVSSATYLQPFPELASDSLDCELVVKNF